MKGKNQKNKRKSELNTMFFIILLALVMFIISTYAWFSTQKNVSITNLNGTVEVAEGLEISLDAENWSNGIVLGTEEGQLDIIKDAYKDHHNISPTEMLPVSTLGITSGTDFDLKMLRGKITNSKQLSEIKFMDETIKEATNPLYPGYFAFDVFLKNSSKTDEDDVLQLNFDSSLEILEAEKSGTGLQNTARIGFAKYSGTASIKDGEPDQATILKATANLGVNAPPSYIADVAIWEPNSSNHVEYIVRNNNKITWAPGDESAYAPNPLPDGRKGFGTDTQIPTYGLKTSAKDAIINDIYNWDGTNKDTLAKQNTLQTTLKTDAETNSDYTIAEGVQDLVSASDGTSKLTLTANAISRIRIYLWLEGQDVDCINYASHGGGIKVNIGLVKGSEEGTFEDPTE